MTTENTLNGCDHPAAGNVSTHAQGTIVHKQIGPITPEVWTQTLLPLICSQQRGSP